MINYLIGGMGGSAGTDKNPIIENERWGKNFTCKGIFHAKPLYIKITKIILINFFRVYFGGPIRHFLSAILSHVEKKCYL